MAKLATQTIVIQVAKAVAESEDDTFKALDAEALEQIAEAVKAFVGEGIVVEVQD